MTILHTGPLPDEAGASGWQDFLLWSGALATVLAGIGGGVYLLQQTETPQDAPGVVPEAILLEMAPLPSTTEDAVEDVAPDQQVMQEQEDIAPSEAPIEEAEPPPEPGPVIEEQLEEPPPEVEPDPLPEPEPEPESEPQPEELPPEETPPVEDVVEEPPPAEAPAEVPPDLAMPMPVQQSTRLLEQRQAQRPTPRPPEQQAAPRTAAPPPANTPPAQRANSAPAGSAAPISRAKLEQWQSQILSYLNRRKQYPRGAQSRGEQGRVVIAFTIDARGNVLSARIASSSGFAELDQEALSLISRVSPLPAPPAEMGAGQTSMNVPISFSL